MRNRCNDNGQIRDLRLHRGDGVLAKLACIRQSRVLWVLTLVAVGGCASKPVSLVRNGTTSVETVASAAAQVWWVDVRSIGSGTQVIGEVIRYRDWPVERPGHVSVELCAPDTQCSTAVEVKLEPVYTFGGNSRRLAFTVTLAYPLSPISTVRVVHHALGCPEEMTAGTRPVLIGQQIQRKTMPLAGEDRCS